jgi:hypothetical protein
VRLQWCNTLRTTWIRGVAVGSGCLRPDFKLLVFSPFHFTEFSRSVQYIFHDPFPRQFMFWDLVFKIFCYKSPQNFHISNLNWSVFGKNNVIALDGQLCISQVRRGSSLSVEMAA